MKPSKALLIIDMQKGSFTSATPRFDTPGVISRINALADQFRMESAVVIYIQHDGTGTGEFEKGAVDWEILDELRIDPKDIRLDKYANDVFYESHLESILTELQVKKLYVTGCATDFCVEASIQSALIKDYQIVVVADAHTTGERPHLSALKVIQHYNWVWQNMIPTKGSIQVIPTATILS